MKITGTTGSITKHSNRLISTTYSDWSAIRDGAFIKFEDDTQFYIVSHTEKRTFLKDFVVIKPNIIQVNENCGANLSIDDSLNISFKEYELNTIYKIINGGTNYKKGDRLTINGGTPSLNIKDNTLNNTIIVVNGTDEKGVVSDIGVIDHGKYTETPGSLVELKGGNGISAMIEVSWKLSDHRSFIERDVQKIEFKGSETIVYLTYPLPNNIKEGKLSTEKWEIILTSSYNEDGKTNKQFQVIRDFTPNLHIPLITKNSLNPEITFNHAITTLDRKIGELIAEIKKLKEN